ncbi:MAG TPA: lytic transglycosylase domain-containing protein [Thermoanaerobaculia bacterium]
MSCIAVLAHRSRSTVLRLLTLPLLVLGAAPLSAPAAAAPPPSPVAAATPAGPPAPGAALTTAARPERNRDLARTYAAAAAALRRHDCATADQALAPLLARPRPDATFARLVSGLYAHACERVAPAEERLFAAADPGGVLEDWRLLLLADSAAANGHALLAQAALAKLLGDYPGSPLAPRALVKAATLAWGQRNASRAFEMIQRGRDRKLAGEPAAQLEGLAWEIAGATGDRARQEEAARRLLVQSPAEAARLQVAEIFRGRGNSDTGIDWSALLSTAQLESRARSLLALDLGTSALTALEAVRARDRDVEWHVLKADILTRDHLGLEALALLSPLATDDRAAQARLEWARARAASDVAAAHRGRANLPAADRKSFQQIAVQHLRRVIESGAEPELAAKALRALYADFAESELFDRAIETLKQLRVLDPADTTGAAHLWALGWREYSRRNYSGAVGYWTELADLYPEDGNARRGRYWTARAFEALGESARAQELYGELAGADTADLYRRNAQVRLTGQAHAQARLAVDPRPEPWPNDPVLERARLLSDLGLDDLALSEMDLVRPSAQPRALAGLDALVLARRGERRKSMLAIRAAFPALGSPYQAGVPQEALRLYYPLDYQDPVRSWAARNRLPASLVYGMIRQESGFDSGATSRAGARGLMQLMPGTARELAHQFGVSFTPDRLTDPSYNLQLGTTYFRQVLSMFDDNLELALAGYNGGPFRIKRLWRERGGEVDRFLEGLDLEESKTYVKRILVLSDSYRQLYPQAG